MGQYFVITCGYLMGLLPTIIVNVVEQSSEVLSNIAARYSFDTKKIAQLLRVWKGYNIESLEQLWDANNSL